MPLPLVVPAAIAGVGALAKYLRGNSQQSKADQILANNKRPRKNVQQEYYDNVALAGIKAANNRLPGANVMETKLSSGVQGGIGNLVNTQRDPASIAAGVAALDTNYNKGIEDLGVKGAQYQEGWQKTLMGARGILGAQKDAAWDWNEKSKYLSAMAAASALQNAANNNKDNAIQDVTGMGTAIAMNAGTPAGGMTVPPGATPPLTNAAQTIPPYNYNYKNSFPFAQPATTPLPTTAGAIDAIGRTGSMTERKQKLLQVYGSVQNVPQEFQFMFN